MIDERTLDRFTQQEASWGRSQCDPFTGRLFDSTHKPIYDVALKSRIDSFLLVEAHRRPELQSVPRTTGPVQRSSDELLSGCRTAPPAPSLPSTASGTRPKSQTASSDPSRRLISHLATNLQQLAGSRSGSGGRATAAVKASSSPGAVCSCGSSSGLYSLPCSHRVCRPCLLASKERRDLRCAGCQEPFALDQPVLCHTLAR